MHARIDDLLSLRDGEPVDVAMRAHVEACAACTRTLASLEALPRRFAALPAVLPGAGGWGQVLARVAATRKERPARDWGPATAVAASLVLLGVLAGMLLRDEEEADPAQASVPVEAGDVVARESIAKLRDRSRILEEILAALPARPAVERAGTALPIDSLQAQVQWVDHQLAVSGAQDAAPAATERLWQERVEIMNTLVQLRYVEAQRVAL